MLVAWFARILRHFDGHERIGSGLPQTERYGTLQPAVKWSRAAPTAASEDCFETIDAVPAEFLDRVNLIELWRQDVFEQTHAVVNNPPDPWRGPPAPLFASYDEPGAQSAVLLRDGIACRVVLALSVNIDAERFVWFAQDARGRLTLAVDYILADECERMGRSVVQALYALLGWQHTPAALSGLRRIAEQSDLMLFEPGSLRALRFLGAAEHFSTRVDQSLQVHTTILWLELGACRGLPLLNAAAAGAPRWLLFESLLHSLGIPPFVPGEKPAWQVPPQAASGAGGQEGDGSVRIRRSALVALQLMLAYSDPPSDVTPSM